MSGENMTAKARIAQLKAERAQLEAEDAQAREQAELEGLELEMKYRKELGKLGVSFAMVDVSAYGDGFIVMKLGEDLPFRTYVDAVASSASGVADAADTFAFVAPCVVHPDQETFAAITRRRGFISNQCAAALQELHGTRAKKVEAK